MSQMMILTRLPKSLLPPKILKRDLNKMHVLELQVKNQASTAEKLVPLNSQKQ
jgi:hypothetical protein